LRLETFVNFNFFQTRFFDHAAPRPGLAAVVVVFVLSSYPFSWIIEWPGRKIETQSDQANDNQQSKQPQTRTPLILNFSILYAAFCFFEQSKTDRK